MSILKDKNRYSDKEKALIEALGFTEIMDIMGPIQLYNIMVSACFVEQRTGPAVESLRRCAAGIMDSEVYRMTPEFDSLIALD